MAKIIEAIKWVLKNRDLFILAYEFIKELLEIFKGDEEEVRKCLECTKEEARKAVEG